MFSLSSKRPDKLLKEYSFSKWFATELSKVLANATGSPECQTFCMGCIQNKEIPDPLLHHWFNGAHQTMSQTNESFMKMTYHFLKNESLFFYEGSEENPKTIDIQNIIDLLNSGKKDWNYEREGANDFSPRETMHAINSDISIAVQTLFTTIGFDMSAYTPKQDKFALMPHTSPTVNNRPIRVEFIVNKCPIIDGKPDTTHSLWHYLTHQGLDKQKDDCISTTKGLTLVAKRTSRSKLTFNQANKEKMAPFNDMWFAADSTALQKVDKTEEVTILGDPVAIPATYNDTKELFKILTGKNFDSVFKVVAKEKADEHKVNELTDDMMALLCILEIASVLTRPFQPKNNINFLQGRLKLYSLLMTRRFGVKKLVGMVELSKELSHDKKARFMNTVLPCTPGELYLRTMILFNDATQITLLPLESQKRQVASLYNYLEQKPNESSILSCLDYNEELRIKRPPIDVKFDGSEEMWKKAEELAKPYYLRSGCFVSCEVLGFKSKALGLSKTQGSYLKGTSTEKALEGSLVEPKAISDFFADALRMTLPKVDIYCMNVTKEFSKASLERKAKKKDNVMVSSDAGLYYGLYNGCEKKMQVQVNFMRRFFYMTLVAFNSKPSTKNQMNFAMEKIREFVVAAVKDPKKAQIVVKDKAANEKTFEDFQKNMAGYEAKCLDGHAYVFDEGKCIYQVENMVITQEVQDKLDWNGNCTNPKKLEFWLTLWLLNSNYSGTPKGYMHWLHDDVKPKPLGLSLLAIVFSHAVFSKLSMRNLIALFANNGSRAVTYSSDIDWLIQDFDGSLRYNNIVSTVQIKLLFETKKQTHITLIFIFIPSLTTLYESNFQNHITLKKPRKNFLYEKKIFFHITETF